MLQQFEKTVRVSWLSGRLRRQVSVSTKPSLEFNRQTCSRYKSSSDSNRLKKKKKKDVDHNWAWIQIVSSKKVSAFAIKPYMFSKAIRSAPDSDSWKPVSNLVFYAQSTITVVSGRGLETNKKQRQTTTTTKKRKKHKLLETIRSSRDLNSYRKSTYDLNCSGRYQGRKEIWVTPNQP